MGVLWQSVIVITTNGSVTLDGRAIFGRGVARQAVNRYPCLAEKLGILLKEMGSHVFDLGSGIVTFPVEETAWSLPDLRIIARSAEELRLMVDSLGWKRIIVPRPGCGGGGLAWKEVQPVLEPWFDNRFTIISM